MQEKAANHTTNLKNNWLEKLSVESWQAEMVISGAAIYGSFILLDYVNILVDWLYFQLPEPFMEFAYFLCFYLYIAVAALLLSFVSHFAIRSLWIASIGLRSVYPEGIKRENGYYNTAFMDQFFLKFPSIDAYNEKLDNMGSSILALAISFVLSFLGFSVLISFVMFLGLILSVFMDENLAYTIMFYILGTVFVVGFLSMFLNMDFLKKKKWVQKIQFPLTLIFTGYIFSNFFYKPVYYFLYTFTTNTDRKKFNLSIIPVTIIVFILTVVLLKDSNGLFLMDKSYRRIDASSTQVSYRNYADEAEHKKSAIISPVIPSKFIKKGDAFWLFLPLPNREKNKIYEACGDLDKEKKVAEEDWASEKKRTHHLACIKEKITFELNDHLLSDYFIKFYSFEHKNEPGVLIAFPELNFEAGENEILIRHFWQNKDGEHKVDRIPFFFIN